MIQAHAMANPHCLLYPICPASSCFKPARFAIRSRYIVFPYVLLHCNSISFSPGAVQQKCMSTIQTMARAQLTALYSFPLPTHPPRIRCRCVGRPLLTYATR